MNFNYYDENELEFYIYILDSFLMNYQSKIEMLDTLKDEFVTELKSRREG